MMRSLPSSGGAAKAVSEIRATKTAVGNDLFMCWRWLDLSNVDIDSAGVKSRPSSGAPEEGQIPKNGQDARCTDLHDLVVLAVGDADEIGLGQLGEDGLHAGGLEVLVLG